MSTRYPIPAHCAVLRNSSGAVLLIRRAGDGPYSGRWSLPGDVFEGGCDWMTSLNRMLSRLSIEAAPGRLTGIYSDPAELCVDGPAGKDHRLVACFRVDQHTGSPRAGSEIIDLGWFSLGQLPESLPKAEARMIQDAMGFDGGVKVR